MKFWLIKEKNLIILIPATSKIPFLKKFKDKKIIEYKYTKTKNYKLNCNSEKKINKIIFIKQKTTTDVLFVFESKKEHFIKGR